MIAWLLLPLLAQADTLDVGPGAYPTIQAAVAAAASGDTVRVAAGTYTGPVVVSKDLDLVTTGPVVLQGTNTSVLDLRGATVGLSGFEVVASGGRGVRVEGGTVQLVQVVVRGNATSNDPDDGAGMAILGGADVTLTDVEVRGNVADARLFPCCADGIGGQILVQDATLTMIRGRLADGEARYGAGLYATGAAVVTLRDVVLEDLVADRDGGAIWMGPAAQVELDGCTFTDTSAGSDGGAIAWDGATSAGALDVRGSTFVRTVASARGGAVDVVGAGGSVTFDEVWFTAPRAQDGGALRLADLARATLDAVYLCDARATRSGGGLDLVRVASTEVERAVVIGGRAGASGGGAIACTGGALDVRFSDLLDAQAGGGAGAVHATGCALTLDSSLVAWTQAGVAVSAAAGATVTHDAFFANTAGDLGAGLSLGTGSFAADPLLPRYRRDGVCGNDDLRTLPGSPLVDAGDPALLDPDGSRADVGAFAGPSAPAELGDDGDFDGVVGLYDCDDADPRRYPGAVEICDGLDNDCDGVVDGPLPAAATTWYRDADGDDFGVEGDTVIACDRPAGRTDAAGDCDDTNRDVRPGGTEVCNDVDDDCNGSIDGTDAQGQLVWYEDVDGDRFGTTSRATLSCDRPASTSVLMPGDCDDADPDIHPDVDETCDDVDRDCDGDPYGPEPVDGTTWTHDGDGDGWGDPEGSTAVACRRPEGFGPPRDCDDTDPDVRPLAPESCDGPDANCDGFTGTTDHDGDGFGACEDCDDADDATFPGADETWYDGTTRDCTSASDYDQDRDGADALPWGDDCDDTDLSVFPGAEDVPDDGVDQDCDGEDAPPLPERGWCAGCDASGHPGALALPALLGFWARRRRRPGVDGERTDR